MKHALHFATVTLAALALAPAVHAQGLTLHSGDVVTVSGAGTVGTINGQTVANSTTAYNDNNRTLNAAVLAADTAAFTLGVGGTITSSNGGIGLYTFGSGNGSATITGGSITAGDGGIGLLAEGSGTVTIEGGTLTGMQGGRALQATGSGTVIITGGTFTTGNGIGLVAVGSGSVIIFSQGDTPFLIDGVPMNNTTLSSYTSGKDTISGTLFNGDTLNTTFYSSGALILNTPIAAPEPSQFAALGIGLLGLGALALKAKKRQSA